MPLATAWATHTAITADADSPDEQHTVLEAIADHLARTGHTLEQTTAVATELATHLPDVDPETINAVLLEPHHAAARHEAVTTPPEAAGLDGWDANADDAWLTGP